MEDTAIEKDMSTLKVEEPSTEALPEDDVVDPWNVQCQSDTGIDYDKLISKLFSSTLKLTNTFKL